MSRLNEIDRVRTSQLLKKHGEMRLKLRGKPVQAGDIPSGTMVEFDKATGEITRIGVDEVRPLQS